MQLTTKQKKMENFNFISIHLKKGIASEFIEVYETTKDHNFLKNLFFNTPYLSTIVRLIQAENSNVKGYDAWRFQADFSNDAIYKALKFNKY
jgi:hypothetical protein